MLAEQAPQSAAAAFWAKIPNSAVYDEGIWSFVSFALSSLIVESTLIMLIDDSPVMILLLSSSVSLVSPFKSTV